MHYLSILTAIASLAAGSAALGINCRGSSGCDGGDHIDVLKQEVSFQDPNRYFGPGEQIGCVANSFAYICAFYQNNNGGTAGDAVTHIQNLIDHGCKNCGSDPTQAGNDVSTGELTVNYVTNGCCPPNTATCACP